MKKAWKSAGIGIAAALMTAALGLDLAPARVVKPEAVDWFGYVYQLIARTFASIELDRLTLTALLAVCSWLTARYLFHKPAAAGVGEYALSAFFGGMTVLCTAVRQEQTVAILWANLFQLPKVLIVFVGMMLLFLMLLRALREGLEWLERSKAQQTLAWFEQKCAAPRICIVLALAWLPHIVARYPGVLMWDSYLQIKQFMGQQERWANHPPFGTWLYGSVAAIGEGIGNRNLVYFLFTLLQCAACIGVLTYSLHVMKKTGVPAWLRCGTLVVYAVSPCYVGWQTVIAKDSSYVLLYILLASFLLEWLADSEHFLNKGKLVLFAFASALLSLCRHNGAAAVVVMLLALLLAYGKKHAKSTLAIVLAGAIGLGLAAGTEEMIQMKLDIRERYIPDVMSMPFQQTGRVVSLHEEEIPSEEAEIIGRVLDYPNLASNYEVDYADAVKDTYQQSATAQDRLAYWRIWLKQLLRYPVEYLDAALHMNGVLFDLRDNEPMYICFSDMSLYDDVYKWSFNDMSMYESEALIPLNSLNRTFTEYYMNFDKIPGVGWLASMSFHALGMIAMLYISWTEKRQKAVLWWLPNLLGFGICLLAPVVYLRYALPFVCTTPIGMAAYYAHNSEENHK